MFRMLSQSDALTNIFSNPLIVVTYRFEIARLKATVANEDGQCPIAGIATGE
jgi:hypothetical protein